MLDLTQYESIGAALTAAIERWPNETCLIEADRERERCRFTYREFRDAAQPLAARLEESDFAAADRAAILMTNQSKWLISAYAIFFAGGVLVPLDYKLSPSEQLALLAHSKAKVLVIEYPLWHAITRLGEFTTHSVKTVLVTEAPAGIDLAGAKRWEEFRGERPAGIPVAQALRYRLHRLFVGHRRPTQRLCADARQLSRAMRGALRRFVPSGRARAT